MDKNIIKKIRRIVGEKHYSTAPEDLHCYSYDASRQTFLPEAVAFPDSSEQVADLLRLASEHNFPVIARGAGSGMTGGSLPVRGGLILACSRLNRIIEIDQDNMVAIIEPGVITGDFQRELRRAGLFYPPDPASLKFCTIGGNVGEGAGGPSAVKYGVTKDFIMGLEVVLANGEILNTGTRTEKGVVGYDLTRLFVGAEGTLGIITKIITRLLPLPEHKETFLITSTSLTRATGLVAEILNQGITPCTLEYLDRTALSAIANLLPAPFPPEVQAILILELDGSRKEVSEQHERLLQLITAEEQKECTIQQATNEKEREQIWQARRAVSPASYQIAPHKISEDVVVPRTRIPDLVAFCEKLSREHELNILTFGHAGDGNLHVNIMHDRNQPGAAGRAEQAKKRLFKQVIKLEGTISGEHGIGITKAPYIGLELTPTAIRTMGAIKQLFDPHNILNPGKIFPQ